MRKNDRFYIVNRTFLSVNRRKVLAISSVNPGGKNIIWHVPRAKMEFSTGSKWVDYSTITSRMYTFESKIISGLGSAYFHDELKCFEFILETCKARLADELNYTYKDSNQVNMLKRIKVNLEVVIGKINEKK